VRVILHNYRAACHQYERLIKELGGIDLQLHNRAVFVIDEAAASGLQAKDYYLHVENERRKLDASLPGNSGNAYNLRSRQKGVLNNTE